MSCFIPHILSYHIPVASPPSRSPCCFEKVPANLGISIVNVAPRSCLGQINGQPDFRYNQVGTICKLTLQYNNDIQMMQAENKGPDKVTQAHRWAAAVSVRRQPRMCLHSSRPSDPVPKI